MLIRTNLKTILTISVLHLCICSAGLADKVIYVDDDANGLNNGTSWQNAYKFLQDALWNAKASDKPVEIRVAQGIYRPGDRSSSVWVTFILENGVAIKGGYAGWGQPDPNARDVAVYKTILSGDLAGNDVDVEDPCDLLYEPTREENSWHVIVSWGTDQTAVLDGFTITGGNYSVIDIVGRGGGGGMAIGEAARPTISNCTFVRNASRDMGGGMHIARGSMPVVTNCVFTQNYAWAGGGISNYSYKGYSRPTVANCTIADNDAPYGPAMACDSDHRLYPTTVTMVNCIARNGPNWLWNNDRSTINVTYSDVQGGWPGVGNINADPCFADPNNGDYHLKSQAGRWDANEGRWMIDEVTSLCIDAGDPASPIGLEPFPNGGIINMGAYGGTAEASKSYFGKPVCETIVAGDINGDCKVDFRDFALIAFHWLEDNSP